ncbi:hypothetical protein BAUCODRAFT_107839 [Baudoinia panamericana UAMH 10762]|uniref:Cytokinesis regulator n=1 Tax=Baudoinia panamericana (strain UAMH 10762) TaxID=717646 RepID=M2NBM9_BAUPA|nr:uncharacterized protein BAUCODRAFT_107839 [Baudoinia panamericana UAMH 10762]EMC96315.1 hypothetical protein BAUCODRAFT_107839 [Baudoinia panamericana UAMH 10762]
MAVDMESENWDEDFQGDFATFAGTSIGTAHTQTSISSRLSVHSESLAGDDDWNVVLEPSDEQSTHKAIQSAQQAGIPLPSNVPSSALLGGTIKRLGKKKSRPKMGDDWAGDLEMPDSAPGGLQLKQPQTLVPDADDENFDDFDELEGSLGIRFAGTNRDTRNRSSSASGPMSPSLGSATAESDMDDFGGLELPEGPMDFSAIILKKRHAAEAELSDLSQPSPAIEHPSTMNVHKKSKLLSDDNDDYLNDFDLGGGNILNNRKMRLNKNLKIKDAKPAVPAQRPATTINFHDKPTDKPVHMRSHLPRPVSGTKPATSRLEPVLESGASNVTRERRQPTTTGTQLLRSKRSMPVLRNQTSAPATQRPSFIPAGVSTHQNQSSSAQRAMPYHLRRESDPNRQGAQSPPPRAPSRLSNAYVPDTPSKSGARLQRRNDAPAALAREAATKRNLTKPARRRNFGDGTELEVFDDLPTSTAKESKFLKEPVTRLGTLKPGLRHTQSRTDIRDPVKRPFGIPERMMTPAPPRTPVSPTKGFFEGPQKNTPSYLRDTAASRIARESRLANNARPRSSGPLQQMSTNWQAQIAARSPAASPSAQRQKGKRPQPRLYKDTSGFDMSHSESNMIWNPQKLQWEGNENATAAFEFPPPLQTPTPTGHVQTSYMDRGPHMAPSASPPRPALIAPISHAAAGVQVNGGMVFDPRQMKWLKLKKDGGRDLTGPISPSVTDGEDEDDCFAGIEDLKDENMPALTGGSIRDGGGMASPVSMAAAGAVDVHEEFDLGPQFIRLQREEEAIWRRKCEGWFVGGVAREEDDRWRWVIREIVPQ